MKTKKQRAPALALFLFTAFLGGSHHLLAQNPIEYFNHAAFLTNAGILRIVNFDSRSPGNNVLSGDEFFSEGLRIIQRDGLEINVVQNTVPGGYGPNYVTEANINSAPNAISTSISVNSASSAPSDNFDFVLTQPAKAAGLFVGNLGSAAIQFLDETNGVVAFETVDINHPGLVNGAVGVNWDNRVFYGIVSETPIKTIRVSNPPNDGDGIVIDDIQFAMPLALRILRAGSEVHIRWPADVTNCQLQAATTLSANPIPWLAVTNSPTVSGNDWVVTRQAAASNEFFRLKGNP